MDEDFIINTDVFDFGPASPSPPRRSPAKIVPSKEYQRCPEKQEDIRKIDSPQTEKRDTPPRDYYDEVFEEFETYINSGAIIIEEGMD